MGKVGEWKSLKVTDDSGVRVYPMRRNSEDRFHILCGCEHLESWRDRILPESFLISGRGGLACWELIESSKYLTKCTHISGRKVDNPKLVKLVLRFAGITVLYFILFCMGGSPGELSEELVT